VFLALIKGHFMTYRKLRWRAAIVGSEETFKFLRADRKAFVSQLQFPADRFLAICVSDLQQTKVRVPG
jgi:hypothetical protein